MASTPQHALRPDEASWTSMAGPAFDPADDLEVLGTGPSPYLVGLLVLFVPVLMLGWTNDALAARVTACVAAWIGFLALFYRHMKREQEASGFDSRGVPL